MRFLAVFAIAALAAASPLAAAPKGQSKVDPKEAIAVPPELNDPALADKLGRMTGVLAKALMELPVGEIEAAIEDRPVTAADRARKVRDVTGADDPGFEQRIAAETATAGKTMQAMTKALVASLPALLASLEPVKAELEKMVANLPDPTYPKR